MPESTHHTPGVPLPQQPQGGAVTTSRVPLTAQGGNARPPVTSLYIHVPFCFHKCHYCDFYSFVDTRDQQPVFVEALIAELGVLAQHAREAPLRTVFVGGGTPSLLRPELWTKLLDALHASFDTSMLSAGGEQCEFTVECNPETVTPELLAVLKGGGVNRLSIGAQSFQPAHLRTLERWHDPASVPRAVELARDAGFDRLSLDLIFAIPGQTREDWRHDLETAISLQTEHLSCYNLTYEPNTAMTRRLERGEFTPADEDLEADMLEFTVRMLADAGLCRYEVSNFARPGAESRHNLVYWRSGHWLAAGPSASGHLLAGRGRAAGSWRWKNVPRLGDYLAVIGRSGGYAPVVDVEAPDPGRLLRERIMMGIRLAEGLNAADILLHASEVWPGDPAPGQRLEAEAHRLAGEGAMEIDGAGESGRTWRLSERGFHVADWAASRLMRSLEAESVHRDQGS